MAFTPRLSAPSSSDLRWIQVGSGGYNRCIYGSDGPPSVLPDCTGYVHGRVMEIRGVTTDDAGLSFGNGQTYWGSSSSNWIQQQNPSLGAVLCYYTNTAGAGQPGHVAIVEQIIDNDTCVVSESNLNDVRWRLVTCYRQYGWRPGPGWNVTAQGFLKNPYVTDTPEPPEPPGPEPPGPVDPVGNLSAATLLLLLRKRRKLHGKRVTSFI